MSVFIMKQAQDLQYTHEFQGENEIIADFNLWLVLFHHNRCLFVAQEK